MTSSQGETATRRAQMAPISQPKASDRAAPGHEAPEGLATQPSALSESSPRRQASPALQHSKRNAGSICSKAGGIGHRIAGRPAAAMSRPATSPRIVRRAGARDRRQAQAMADGSDRPERTLAPPPLLPNRLPPCYTCDSWSGRQPVLSANSETFVPETPVCRAGIFCHENDGRLGTVANVG